MTIIRSELTSILLLALCGPSHGFGLRSLASLQRTSFLGSRWVAYSGQSPVPAVIARMPGFKNPDRNHRIAEAPCLPACPQFFASEGHSVHALTDPWWSDSGNITLVTVETRREKVKIAGIENAGEDRLWNGFITKVAVMLDWLNMQTDEEALVIFVDGEDTIFGGCSQEQFMGDLRHIVDRSGGADIIVGAERGCYECPKPWTCEMVPDVPEWAHLNWSLAGGGQLHPKSPVDSGGQARFVNSGFVSGPVGKLRPFYARVLETMKECHIERCPGDQYYIAREFLSRARGRDSSMKEAQSMTLDYSSRLVTCGYSLRNEMLFELQEGGGMHNRVTERQQCFFHANGWHNKYWETSKRLAEWQRGGPRPW